MIDMELIIKVLNGQDCRLQVEPNMSIQQVKQLVESNLNIPVAQQKLLYLGRTLIDDTTLASYANLKSGSKLNLVVSKAITDSLHSIVLREFRKYYNETQADYLAKEFVIDIERKCKLYSLDDWERMASELNQ